MFRDRQRKEITNKFEVKIKKKKNYFFKLLIKNIEKNDY